MVKKLFNLFKLRQFSIFFAKFFWIGPWVSRIDWCEGHWHGSTYMVVRLSSISPKQIHSIDPWTSCSRVRSKRVKEANLPLPLETLPNRKPSVIIFLFFMDLPRGVLYVGIHMSEVVCIIITSLVTQQLVLIIITCCYAHKVSFLGFDSLWGDCTFIPAD